MLWPHPRRPSATSRLGVSSLVLEQVPGPGVEPIGVPPGIPIVPTTPQPMA
jgi:hypothetical protein